MNNISKDNEDKVNILRKNFRHNKDIIFLVKGNNKILEEKEMNKEFDYIFNKNLDIKDKISMFIKNSYDEVISVEEIKKILEEE